jgi:hypothetical protein
MQITQLPAELLQSIFFFATSASCTGHNNLTINSQISSLNELAEDFRLPHDGKIRSATFKTKRDLALVCRIFRSLSQKFLYETVICYDTLKTIGILVNGDRGRFVKNILFMPNSNSPEHIGELYRICCNLEEINVYPLLQLGEPVPHPSDIVGPLPSTVCRIVWIQHIPALTVFTTQASLENLRALTLMSTYNIFVDEPMCLPRVEIFHVASNNRFPNSMWSFPSLKHVRVVYRPPSQTEGGLFMSQQLQRFLKTHAPQFRTLCLETSNPLLIITQADLYTDMLSECTRVQVLLVSHVLPLFLPKVTPKWTLPALRCVALILDDGHPVDIPDFMRLWNGFHASEFSHVEQFVCLHHHSSSDSTDLQHIDDMCGYDQRLVFQCRSDFVAY